MTASTDRLSLALADRYHIERELGAGGMATVYLAQDLKHERKVALKVLKPELAAVLGAERFVVEIKTTASLQHPHILPLFDSGTADGFLFYVMPFIEGETLRDKLNRETQFGVAEAVRIALDVADALDYAHRRGVIHRDIKPENILLHDGRPMVADFGIALAVSAAAGGRMTETGLSLGTPHYMSPEQATADKEITGRSDIYSLGSVLYEMLAGQPPHLGGSAQQIIMKIIAEPVDNVTRYRKAVPPNVAAALGKALEKLPADRFSSAKEFADALQNAAFTTGSGTSARMPVQPRVTAAQRWLVPTMFALLAAAALLGIWGWLRPLPVPPSQTLRYVDALLADNIRLTQYRDFAISPDGERIAIVSGSGARPGPLLIRERNQLLATSVAGSEGAVQPFFSRDGRRIAFFVRSSSPGGGSGPTAFSIRTAGLDGGAQRTIVNNVAGGALWEEDAYIYFIAVGSLVVSRVNEGGGAVSPFTKLDTAAGETRHRSPKSLNDGRRILFTVDTRSDGSQVAIADLATGKHRRIGLSATVAWYAGSGHIVYLVPGGTLMAVPFDAAREVISGEPEVLLEGIGGGAASDIDFSASGTLIYLASENSAGRDEVIWVNRDGSMIPSTPWNADFADLALSRDGKQLVVGIRERNIVELWVQDIASGSRSRVTFEADGSSTEPAWTPDGKSIAFIQSKDGKEAIFQRRADGSTAAERIMDWQGDAQDISWSPDGKELLVVSGFSGNPDIFKVTPGVDSIPRPLLDSRFTETEPTVSPDGRWLAYASNESGVNEVYVRPFKDIAGARIKVSINGGSKPNWSDSGQELYYVRQISATQTDSAAVLPSMMVAVVQPGATFSHAAPRVLFSIQGPIAYWGATPDGKRFVIIRQAQRGGDARPEIVVVENWLRELKKESR